MGRGATSHGPRRSVFITATTGPRQPGPPAVVGRRRGRRRSSAARRRRRAARRSGTAAAPGRLDGPPSVRSRSPPTSRIGRTSPALEAGGERRRRWRRRRARPARAPPRPTSRRGGSSSVGGAPREATGRPTTPSATTPRNARSATSRARWRVSASGATRASWRARSMSCFIVRTKSPPVISLVGDDLGEVLAEHPGVGGGDEPRIGRAVLAEADRALVGGEVLARRLDRAASGRGRRPTGTTAAGPARGCGARTRTPTAARRASPRRARRGDPAAGTRRRAGRLRGTDARQHRAAVGERPRRRRRRSRGGRARRGRGRTRGPGTGCGRRRGR